MAVRSVRLGLILFLLFGCVLLAGCTGGDAPVTAETSKFKPVDSTVKKSAEGQVPETGSTSAEAGLPSAIGTLPTDVRPPTRNGEGTAATDPVAARNPVDDPLATKPAPAPGETVPGEPAEGEIAVSPEVNQAFQFIEQLKESDPPGNSREEQLQYLISVRRKIAEIAAGILKMPADPRVHKVALQEAQLALAQLAQLRDQSAITRMTLFAQGVAKHPNAEIARQGRLMTFNVEIIAKLQESEKIDTEALLKRIQTLLDEDGGDVEAFSVTTSVCQILSERGEAETAAKAMRMIAEAYKDTQDKDLADAVKSLPDSARVVELNLPKQLSNILDKKEGAETKLLADIEGLLQTKNPNPIFVRPIMDVMQPIEMLGKTMIVEKLLGLLEVAYSTHENADAAKFVNEQLLVPSRKRYALVGQPFAPQAVTVEGQELDLKPLAGKVLLVSVWGTVVQTSLEEIPVLRKLQEDLQDRGFAVIGLDIDVDLKRVEQFMRFQRTSMPYANYLSPEVVRGEKIADWHTTSLAQSLGLQSLPIYLLVGKDGKIDSIYHYRLDPERLGGRLKELLGLEEVPVFAVKPKPMVIENPTLPKAAPIPNEPPPTEAPKTESPKSEPPKTDPPKQGQLLRPSWLERVDRQLAIVFARGSLHAILLAEDEPAKTDEAAKEPNPYLAKPGQSATQLTDWVLRMLDKPKTIQGRPGFAAAIVDACDRVLADKSAKETEQLVAIENKLAVLHKAACAGDETCDQQLAAFVVSLKDDARPRVARETAFFVQERKVLDASEAKPEELAKLLQEIQDYFAKEKLASKHLRMASATVDLINKLENGDTREKHFADFGNLFAKSSDKELARYGKKLAKKPETKESDLIGKPLELAGNTAGGLPFAWEKYRGKVVIVDFWATWCGPCLKEMPNVKAFREKHKDKGFDIVGVSVDKDLEALETFLDDNDLPWETLAGDEAGALAEKYGVRAIPTMMLIDKKGNVVAVAHNIAALATEAEKLLAEK